MRAPSLADPEIFRDGPPLDRWAELRRNDPITREETTSGHWFWSVTRYRDVVTALSDPRTFTSSSGNMLSVIGGGETGAGRMLATCDGDYHEALYRYMAFVLSRVRSTRFEEVVQQSSRRVVDSFAQGSVDGANIIASLIAEIAGWVVGLPREVWEEAQRLCTAAVAPDDEAFDTRSSEIARLRLLQFLRAEAVRRRRPHVGDRVVLDALLDAKLQGRRLRSDELLLNAFGTLLGASVTMGHVLSGMIHAAVQLPGAWRRWWASGVTREAVDEAVRWTSPTAHFTRCATRDVVLGDVRIARGDVLALWLGSANRDEREFLHPNDVDTERRPNRHVGFGYGPHHCVGASMARFVLTVVFSDLARSFDGFVRSGSISWYRSNFLSGLKELEVEAIGHQTA